tara:strand:- start:9911 stop:10486 length:576 start_codon:yes stop_codon:yes gene_type:complete
MALTYRSVKGSALTITELDDNFRHFTSSHSITASAEPVIISGSNVNNIVLETTGSVGITGSLVVNGNLLITGSIIPSGSGNFSLGNADNYFEELYLSYDSIVFISGSTSSSFGIDPSGSLSGSFDGVLTGSVSGSFTGSADVTGSLSGSFSGSIDGTEFYLYGLPTAEPTETGRLWLSGSASNSKYLMVRD